MHAVCAENGHSSPAGNNGDVQLTVREMLDVPSDSRPVDLPAQDRDAFADAGVLEQRRSVQPGDRAPPQPLVRTLEEVAEKLGESLAMQESLWACHHVVFIKAWRAQYMTWYINHQEEIGRGLAGVTDGLLRKLALTCLADLSCEWQSSS